MKIGAMIKILEKIREKHGNIDLLVCDDDGRITSPRSTQVVVSEGEYPDHWDMPEGFKFVQVNA
jgi:hypothetical protein